MRLSALIVLPLVLGCQLVGVPEGLCFRGDGCDAGTAGGSGGGGGAGGGGGGGGGSPMEATLVAPLTLDFGEVEIGVPVTRPLQIRNAGLTASGPLSVIPFAQVELQVVGGDCGSSLAPGATCSLNFALTPQPSTPRFFTASLQVTAQPGGTLTTMVSGKPMWRVTVTLASPGPQGRVTTPDGGISCFLGIPACSALFEKDTRVVLNAQTQNGSQTRFLHWQSTSLDGGPVLCEGQNTNFPVLTGHQCALMTIKQHTNVAATFAQTNKNLVFLSSQSWNGDLGGLSGADAKCNTLATAAGINTTDGDGFVAWLSDANTTAASRIPANTGGFERMDMSPNAYAPFAFTRQDLLTDQILLPLNIDEQGNHRNQFLDDQLFAWTGTNSDGTNAAANCNAWVSAAGTAQVGRVQGGPGQWTSRGMVAACNELGHLYCIQISSQVPLLVPTPSGKLVYFTTGPGFLPGGGLAAADAYCDLHRPPATAPGFSALLSTTTNPASSRLIPGVFYFRVDGLFVGRGSDISSAAVAAIPWVRDDRTTSAGARVWTGATVPSGTSASTCSNWTSSAGFGLTTDINLGGPRWFSNGTMAGQASSCNVPQQLICVQN